MANLIRNISRRILASLEWRKVLSIVAKICPIGASIRIEADSNLLNMVTV